KAESDLLISAATNSKVAIDEWVYVSELFNWYLERALDDKSLSQKRKRNIRSTVTKHILPLLGGEKLSDLSPALIEDEFIWPLQNHMKISTIRQQFALLKRAFKIASKQGRISNNPIADISFTDFYDKKIKSKPSALLPQHLPELWYELSRHQSIQERLAAFMLMHGTRIGETRQLKWSFIDWNLKRLTIPEEFTKGQCSENVIVLTDSAIDWLNQHRKIQRKKGYRGNYLFPGEQRGTCLTESQVSKIIQSISKGQWCSHDLRKLARTMWIQLGVDYWVAERLLNHAMTKLDEAYIHTQAEEQKLKALIKWHANLCKTQNNA
ncbi:tyrosine-type recombinase/integrase, partial [Photobacterium damselae]|uniref:tyrosine-type recombinase/integrase n=1 Tax=Photobacterium damselae TaxID=38293 RepID=UPI0040682269